MEEEVDIEEAMEEVEALAEVALAMMMAMGEAARSATSATDSGTLRASARRSKIVATDATVLVTSLAIAPRVRMIHLATTAIAPGTLPVTAPRAR